MTCEDCIHLKVSKTVDKDFNVTEQWMCGKSYRNLKHFIEYSETFRLMNPRSPLSIIYYDNTKKPCSDHKVGGILLNDYISKDSPTQDSPSTPSLPSFLERD